MCGVSKPISARDILASDNSTRQTAVRNGLDFCKSGDRLQANDNGRTLGDFDVFEMKHPRWAGVKFLLESYLFARLFRFAYLMCAAAGRPRRRVGSWRAGCWVPFGGQLAGRSAPLHGPVGADCRQLRVSGRFLSGSPAGMVGRHAPAAVAHRPAVRGSRRHRRVTHRRGCA